ncbi:MAG TPA: Ig-like domain repeat protein [Solirubrobacterales bacterium]
MKARPVGPRVVALMTALALLCGLAAASSASAAVLSGTVSGQAPGEEAKPLPETNVTVTWTEKEEIVGTATADLKGEYSLEIPDGVYDVRFDPPSGFEATTAREVEVEGSLTLNVVLKTSQPTVDLTGVLRDAEGEPVPGVHLRLDSQATEEQVEIETGADGSYAFTVAPGAYRFHVYATGETNPNLPQRWDFSGDIKIEADRELMLKLPAVSKLTVEALGAESAPIAEAQVRVPLIVGETELGGGLAGAIATRGPAGGKEMLQGTTGVDGRISFRVFAGNDVGAGEPEVVPPLSTGYGRTTFAVPTIEGDTTLVVQFTKGGEEEPEGEDVKGPQLNEFGIEPGPIDTSKSPQSVVAYANISDDLSGFHKGAINFRAPNGELFLTTFNFKRVSGNANAGDYQILATFPQFSEAGTYTVDVIYLYDAVNNETAIKEIDLKELGWQHTVTVASEEADTEAPMVDELAVEPTSIDTTGTSRTVNVFAHVTDDIAGAKEVLVSFGSPSGNSFYTGSASKPASGSATNGGWEIPVTFQPFSEAGAWTIASIQLFDAAGNARTLDKGQIEELGLQREVQVEGTSDIQGPTLTELGIEPTSVDTTSELQLVTLRAHIDDDLSGFVHGSVTFTSPSGSQGTSGSKFDRYAGTSTSGDYLLQVPFKEFSETGAWKISQIKLVDATGNETLFDQGQVEENGFPNTVLVEAQPPTVTGVNPAFGPEAGGNEVEISGTGFGKESQVWFGEKQAESTTFGANLIVAVAPPGSGTVDVTVTSGSGSSPITPADRYQYSPQVVLTSSPNPSVKGQKVTFTAKVLPQIEGSPTPLGTVAFVEGTSTLGVVNLSKGTATFNTTALGAGKHPVVARYSGDSYYGQGEAEAITQVVEKAETQVTLTSPFEPASFGSSGSLKATVKAVAPGAGTPAGTITFREGENVLATVQLSGSSASLPLKSLPLGTHGVTASYSGDPNYQPSGSEPLTQTIVPAATELALTSTLNPAPYGSSGTLKATVDAPAPSVVTPTGSVTFWEGEEALATVPLAAGVAKYPLKSFSPGSHPIHATFNAPPEFEASQAELTQVVTEADTETELTSTLFPAPYGSSGTLKATVKAIAGGGGTPSGTVTFLEGETVLAVVPISNSVAKYPLKSLSPGVHQIKAIYGGDGNYKPSEGQIEQLVVKAATSVAVTSGKNPAPSGSSGSIKATVKALAPGGGTPTGTVTFSEGEAVLAVVPLSSGSATYPLKSLSVGTHEIVARYNGNPNYEPDEGLIVQTISP